MDFLRPTFVHVYLDRLMGNLRFLQKAAGSNNFLCPMIKANAYGHGDVAVAKAIEKESIQYIGVASVEEAYNLRKGNISLNILTFGFYGADSVREMLHQNLTPVVSDVGQLELLVKNVKQPQKIHLKFNTGMNRLGLPVEDLKTVQSLLVGQPLIQVEGLCTHLFEGENITILNSSSNHQIHNFQTMIQSFWQEGSFLHVYNSSAMAKLIKQRGKFVYGSRPGLLVYGIDPGEKEEVQPLVSPVMEFKSKIVSLQQVKSGEVVSYGGTWQAKRDSVVGIVPAGYGDGVKRSLSNKGEVLVRGQRVPICGRVCMDYTMIDCTKLSTNDNLVGEDVVFFGRQGGDEISITEVSKKANCVNYEIMTGISERVPRYYGA